MKAGTLLLILHDVIEGLVSIGILDQDGNFKSPNLNDDVKIYNMVAECLKRRGYVEPEEVHKVMSALPFVMSIVRQ